MRETSELPLILQLLLMVASSEADDSVGPDSSRVRAVHTTRLNMIREKISGGQNTSCLFVDIGSSLVTAVTDVLTKGSKGLFKIIETARGDINEDFANSFANVSQSKMESTEAHAAFMESMDQASQDMKKLEARLAELDKSQQSQSDRADWRNRL